MPGSSPAGNNTPEKETPALPTGLPPQRKQAPTGLPPLLEKLILNKRSGKYRVVELISFWAKELRKLEEHRHLTQTEILELAMTEVLGEKISEAELLKKKAAGEAAEAVKKDPLAPKKKVL